ncbi:unnamed protein product [Lathyrus sativus]|nr:unnamed protein product [Lathyrus sativus]
MKAKRGRGRSKTTVPSSPVNHPSPSMQLDKESVNQFTVEGDSSNSNEKSIDEEVVEVETLEYEIEDPKARKPWDDILSENRNTAMRSTIEYVAPTLVNEEVEVEIEEKDIGTEIKFWETALIMYVLGEDLSMITMKNYMTKAWNFIKLPDMYYHDEGYFLLIFKSHSVMDVVMMKGSYTIRNMLMLLTE